MSEQNGSPEHSSKQSEKPTPSVNKELVAGNKIIKPGDLVAATRTSGEIESDWSLRSFGGQFAVVQKPDPMEQGKLLQKLIPIEEFRVLQASQQTENEDLLGGAESKDPKHDITGWRNRFIKLVELGVADKVDEGMVENFKWQQVRYGEGVKGKSDQLYRGYLMVESEAFPLALGILARIARERKTQGKTTEFKWLLKTEEPDWIDKVISGQDWKPKEIGDYQYLNPEDPRIALYADTLQDVRDILSTLVQHPQWQGIEEIRNRKYGGNAPRRPGTNSFQDASGKEWRSLNYNDKRGLSELEAKDPQWRDQKQGIQTQNR